MVYRGGGVGGGGGGCRSIAFPREGPRPLVGGVGRKPSHPNRGQEQSLGLELLGVGEEPPEQGLGTVSVGVGGRQWFMLPCAYGVLCFGTQMAQSDWRF